jgi:DNA transformation protein
MAVSRSFVAHALDLLALAGPVQARSMFGGYGLYLGGAMFGLLDDDELYLKADDATRQAFLDAGSRQWTYPGPKGPAAGGYYRPPDDALEDPESMLPWARLGVEAGRRALEKKLARKPRRRSPASGTRATAGQGAGARVRGRR